MTTEQKIRKAFDKYINEMFKLYGDDPDMRNVFKRERANGFDMFSKGYMSLLNDLEKCDGMHFGTYLYALPEGVTREPT